MIRGALAAKASRTPSTFHVLARRHVPATGNGAGMAAVAKRRSSVGCSGGEYLVRLLAGASELGISGGGADDISADGDFPALEVRRVISIASINFCAHST